LEVPVDGSTCTERPCGNYVDGLRRTHSDLP
jgi:hypothetical protein